MRAGARRARVIAVAALIAAAALLAASRSAAESDGRLDPYFGSGGIVRTIAFQPGPTQGTLDVARAVAVQPDGKIVVGIESSDDGYEFVIARYQPDGTLDTSFGGGDGLATVEASGDIGIGDRRDDLVADIALQPDGKIVAVGSLEPPRPGEETKTLKTDFALVRLNPDGSPDAGFGTGGIVGTDFDTTWDYGKAVALQPDGRILVGGVTSVLAFDNYDFALARYLPDGRLDPSFSGDGKLVANMSTSKGIADDWIEAVALAPDGDVIAAGNASNYNSDLEVVVARYRSDGGLDTSFGAKGIARIDLTDRADVISGLALLADGQMRLPLRMTAEEEPHCDLIGVLALTEDGAPAGAFGAGGHVAIDASSYCDEAAHAIAIQPNGKIVIGGGGWTEFTLARFSPQGALDPTFAGTGVLTLPIDGAEPYTPSESSTVNDLALDPAEQIVAVGSSKPGGVWSEATIARFTDPCTVANQTAQISGRRLSAAKSRLKTAQTAQRRKSARMRTVRLAGRARDARRRVIGKQLRRAKKRTASRRRAVKRARRRAVSDRRATALACGLPYSIPSRCPKAKATMRRHRKAVRRMKRRVAKLDRPAPALRAKLKTRRAKLAKAQRSVRKQCPRGAAR